MSLELKLLGQKRRGRPSKNQIRVLDDILTADDNIRYVFVLSSDLKEVASKARLDLKFRLGKKDIEENYVKFVAPVVLGTLSRFSDRCGNLVCAGARFNKVTMLFFKIGDSFVVVSAEPVPPYPIMQKLEERLKIQHS